MPGRQIERQDFDLLREHEHEIVHNLWLGGHPPTYEGYAMVVSCERHERKTLTRPFRGFFLHVPFDDDHEVEPPTGSLLTASQAVLHALEREQRVLVHCTAGLNRSSLLVSYVLKALGYSPEDAVELIRQRRDEWCLCNKLFEQIALRA